MLPLLQELPNPVLDVLPCNSRDIRRHALRFEVFAELANAFKMTLHTLLFSARSKQRNDSDDAD